MDVGNSFSKLISDVGNNTKIRFGTGRYIYNNLIGLNSAGEVEYVVVLVRNGLLN